MTFEEILLKSIKKIYALTFPRDNIGKQFDTKKYGSEFIGYVQLFNQEANDYITKLLEKEKPCMISKFGTLELNTLCYYKILNKRHHNIDDILSFIKGEAPTVNWTNKNIVKVLCTNAGFFPNDINLIPSYFNINYEAMKQIDVLGSYIKTEFVFKEELAKAKKVNLDGYYAPYYWNNPWSKVLAGKKILVVHPFSEDIEYQYKNHRTQIWQDKNVLPKFHLITYKSVQSMLGLKTPYQTWFEALEKMKEDIYKIDFDIALIGCGAYGMPLAAFVKSMGKQAIHLAGWTQVLFGIIGVRWENNPRVSKLINDYWIHPSKSNIPHDAKRIENGAYW